MPFQNHFCQVPLSLILEVWTVVNVQNLTVVHLKEFFKKSLIVEVENWKRKCPPILYVKPLNERFIIPLISFSSLLTSSFLKMCMVLSEHPTHHIRCAWKKKTTEKKPFKCSWCPEKILVGFKVQCWKNHA